MTLHYSQIGLNQPLIEAWIDKETKGKSVGLRQRDGIVDYMPYDQPLALVFDPDFMLQNHVEVLIAEIKKAIRKQGISKRYLAGQLGTSDNQVQRLLNPGILNKNLSQLYHMAALLGLDMELHLKKAA